MKSKSLPLISAAFCSLFSAVAPAFAQGTAFTYQGRLNEGGNPANGLYDFRSGPVATNIGGALIAGPVTNAAVVVSNGLFVLTLDFGPVFDGTPYWLQIGVRTNGGGTFTPLSPRPELTPTPYSIFASTASNLSGTLSAAQLSGIIPSANLSGAYGNALNLNNAANTLTGSFSGNGANITSLNANNLASGTVADVRLSVNVALRAGGNNLTGNQTVTSGNVGIGTTLPKTALQVNGSNGTAIRVNGPAGGGSTVAYELSTYDPGTNAPAARILATDNGNFGDDLDILARIPGSINNALVSRLHIDSATGIISGNGGGLTNLNANAFNGSVWQTGGNTVSAGQFFGSTNNAPVEIWAGNARAFRLEPNTNGAPNVIGGSPVNYMDAGGVFGGFIGGGGATNYNGSAYTNRVSAFFGSIVGGYGNWIQSFGSSSVIGGGYLNTIAESACVIDGGSFNSIQNQAGWSVIGGGYGNIVETTAETATISGGYANTVGNVEAAIGGGQGNVASGVCATVGGGLNNTASGDQAMVGGGHYNTASGGFAMVPGGSFNQASASYSFAAGNRAQAIFQGDFVWADSQSTTFSATANDQFLIRAQGGVGINTASPQQNLSVNGGMNIDQANTNSGIFNNGLSSGAGLSFGASSGEGIASQRTPDTNAFQNLSRQYDLVFYTGFNNRITILNNGNVGIGTSQPFNLLTVGSGGAYCDGFTWNNGSDKNSKQDFVAVNPRDVLEKVQSLPITEWQYKVDSRGQRHLGPMAQDFHAAFGLNGSDDKHIATVDEEGVALAAIQGLNEKVESGKLKAESRLEKLEAENAELKTRLAKLERLLNAKNGGPQ